VFSGKVGCCFISETKWHNMTWQHICTLRQKVGEIDPRWRWADNPLPATCLHLLCCIKRRFLQLDWLLDNWFVEVVKRKRKSNQNRRLGNKNLPCLYLIKGGNRSEVNEAKLPYELATTSAINNNTVCVKDFDKVKI